jgi:hypothetical protein
MSSKQPHRKFRRRRKVGSRLRRQRRKLRNKRK